ncbi:glycerophosphodiester phosphodiesterase [Corynebacterium lizhenjunii]|uniref:Glycerophosphodiester phosphodiesterase n=1 Tax=Corynebacterium lizhenjunii TaxID=2709394 RepID=A0A7T0PBV7_9CORY|nr:glycerophosphodiester phosphodiesterase family protein [Corynebacterium lizhenjunii]QPK79037.1 glycerophosphodiester phosphodiesterase [Corynebacterium lizhenjunii]
MHIVAHRGYNGKYPEQTPLAFEKALELPIHGVECDVRMTKDGKLVVHHDSTMDRTSNISGRVSRMDWADIRGADIGDEEHGVQHPLLLEELIEMVAPTGRHLYIETKHPSCFGTEVEEQVALRLRYAGLLDDPHFHLISFSHRAVRTMLTLAPAMDCIYLRRDWERRFNRHDVMLSRPSGLGMSLVRAKLWPGGIGKQGLPTYLWTVDDPEDVAWAQAQGVDILATNEPEVALQALGG